MKFVVRLWKQISYWQSTWLFMQYSFSK